MVFQLPPQRHFDAGRAMRDAAATDVARTNVEGAQRQFQQQDAMRDIAQQAAPPGGDYDVKKHVRLARQKGFTDVANKLEDIESGKIKDEREEMTAKMEVIYKSIPLVMSTPEQSWGNFAGMLEGAGISQNVPREYGPEAQQMLTQLQKNLDQIAQDEKWGKPEAVGNTGTVRQQSSTGEYGPDLNAKKGSGEGGTQASVDRRSAVSTISKAAAQSRGGLFDPRTNEITGLKPAEYGTALRVKAIALEIYDMQIKKGQQGNAVSALEEAEWIAQEMSNANLPPDQQKHNFKKPRNMVSEPGQFGQGSTSSSDPGLKFD